MGGTSSVRLLNSPGAQLTHPDVELAQACRRRRPRTCRRARSRPALRVPSQFVTRENVALASGFRHAVPPGAVPPTSERTGGDHDERHPRQPCRAAPAASGRDASSRPRPAALRPSRRSRSGRRRYPSAASSDPSSGSGAAAVESAPASRPAEPTSPARARGSWRSSRRLVSPDERDPPGQHLVEHAPEGPDVRALVDRQSARLLGTHVGGSADDGASMRLTL